MQASGSNHRQLNSYLIQQATNGKTELQQQQQQPQQQLPPSMGSNGMDQSAGKLASRNSTTTTTSRGPSSGNGRSGNFMTNFMAAKLPIASSIFPSIKQHQKQQQVIHNYSSSNNNNSSPLRHHNSTSEQQQRWPQQQQVLTNEYRTNSSSSSGAQMSSSSLDKTTTCPQKPASSLPQRYMQNGRQQQDSSHMRIDHSANHQHKPQLHEPEKQLQHQNQSQMQKQQLAASGPSSQNHNHDHQSRSSPVGKHQEPRAFHVNFNRDSQNVGQDDESAGESRKKKYLTAKYGQQQMNLIKKRLKIETWLYEQLKELASGTKSEAEMEDVDIDLDQLLDMDDDETRRRWLKKTLEPFDDLRADRVETFIGQVIEQSKLL